MEPGASGPGGAPAAQGGAPLVEGEALLAAALERLQAQIPAWELRPGELDVDMSLTVGCGSTSVVYLGRLRGETIVAVKDCMLERPDIDSEAVWLYLRELEVWSRVNHPQILHFFGFSVTPSGFRICSEFCRGGTLFDLLHNCWHIPLSWQQRRKILVDISLAVEYMHTLETPIMHRDLKSLNVLLLSPVTDEKARPQIKLADFGFARIRRTQRPDDSAWSDLTQGAGTPHWMAPEVAFGTRYHEKVDIFSLSIIMYEVVCRHMAFEDLEPESVRQVIASGGRPSLEPDVLPPDVPPALLDLMVRCWDQEPGRRPSISAVHDELLEIPWPAT